MLTTEDILAIHHLMSDYGHVVDDHLWDRAHEVFSDDFVFDMSASGRPDLHGVADIVATFRGRNMYAHHSTNVTIVEEIDDRTVTVHSKFLGFPNDGGTVSGDYHDTVVKTDAGWRIQRRRATRRQRQFFD